jgi:flagellar FliL protein
VSEAKVKEAPAKKAEAAEGAEEGGKKKLPLKLIIIIAVAAVVVLGGGGTAAFLLLQPKDDAAHAGKHKEKKPEKKEEKKGKDGKGDQNAGQVREGPDGIIYFTMPDIVVNMQTADGRPTFLKLKLTFEMPDQDSVDALQPNMPRLQDMFQSFLRELRPEDLAGSQGSYQLRMEIQRRVNLVIAPAHTNAVLIEEMLIN